MDVIRGWESFLVEIRSFLETCNREFDGASEDYSYVMERLTQVIQDIGYVRDMLSAPNTPISDAERASLRDYAAIMTELMECLSTYFHQQWEHHIDGLYTSSSASYGASVVRRGRGRPVFNISRDQLEYLSSLNFTWTEISSILGISRNTVYRPRQEYGLLHVRQQISDDDLRSQVRSIRRDHPDMGEVMVRGRLQAVGVRASRARVRLALRETDPLSISARHWLGSTARRPYSVPGPNSLWHIGKST